VDQRTLYERIVSAVAWAAAFSLASGAFLSLTLLFHLLPPTEPVAIGRVTIERYAKLGDYLGAALFFLTVPLLTIWLKPLLQRGAEWSARGFRSVSRPATEPSTPAALLFLVPFLFSPFFYLTTAKVGWVFLLPAVLAFAGPRVLWFARTRRWVRSLFRPELGPYHALLFAEGLSWLFFRYLVTSRRIAHVPTIFLEVVFAVSFLAIFWIAALLISRLMTLNFGHSEEDVFRRLTIAALPLVTLPFLAVIWVPLPQPRLFMTAGLLVVALLAMLIRRPLSPQASWRLAAWLILPALIYLFSYASTAQLSQWIDLFHRGEAIGPASDYLRGKVPFRDVFALHGMLEDGQLDAWLMAIFGRSLEVAVARTVVVGAFLGVAIWFLGIAVFRSIPLALLCVAMSSWTTAENNRTFFQVAAVALFWNALQRRSRLSAVASGLFAGVALFFSYEIGLYSIAGAIAASLLLWISSRRVGWSGLPPGHAALFFLLGTGIGAAPFAIYLASRGALGDFVEISFFTIPAIIDSVWSLPFPDLISTFRHDFDLHKLAEFILWEKFHLIVSPLVIAIAAIYYIQRWLNRRVDLLDQALLVLTVFATIAQRTAFGRVSFRHQYFAAFLIGPLIVLLAVIAVRALRKVWDGGNQGTRAFLSALVLAMVPLIVVLFWIPDLVNARLHEFTRYYGRLLRVDHTSHSQEVAWRIENVSAEIQRLTAPDEPIFDFSNQPAFYFFADRPNPTRFYQVPILSPIRFQRETIEALERARPKVVLRRSPELFDQFDGVTNDLRAQAVSGYLDEMYEFHKSVRGVELWTRRARARARPVADYLGLIRLPDRKELVSGGVSRMVFPAVGSLPGMGGSYWQSDLTIHNPFRDPIRIRLRYVTGGRGIDREVTIADRQTLRWPDVVSELFSMRGAIGTLWLEHREGQAPVAVVKTSDVAHGATASIEKPLTRRDAAAAGTPHPELALIGIPAAGPEGRRVNAGVVNMGRIPATFRFSIRDGAGQLLGAEIESGVLEDEVWIVNDLESTLGAELDETMTVRITVVAGTGVGFATVISTNGDAEFITATPAERQ
jgi:hypothetical protein